MIKMSSFSAENIIKYLFIYIPKSKQKYIVFYRNNEGLYNPHEQSNFGKVTYIYYIVLKQLVWTTRSRVYRVGKLNGGH